jgi:hypothetical protein
MLIYFKELFIELICGERIIRREREKEVMSKYSPKTIDAL